jgi:4-hydroxy-tetrahydrodipicolinate synthase
MADLNLHCRAATPFKTNGDVDESALREFLQRFIASKIGIYLCSVAGGESRSLSSKQLETIYRIGVEECKGKIQVFGNPPEAYSVADRRTYIDQAIASGVDAVVINFYSDMRLNDAELKLYFRELLKGISLPVSIAINHDKPGAEVMAEICNEHRQIVAFNMSHGADGYFVKFTDGLKRDIDIYVQTNGSLAKLAMGAKGVFGTEANIIPKTQKAYVDACVANDREAIARNYRQLVRFGGFMSKWFPLNPRAIKLGFRVLKLPGWEGGLHESFQMSSEEEYQRFADGLLRLGIPEITEQARRAGIVVPS